MRTSFLSVALGSSALLLSGSVTAYTAAHLPKHSVGTKQLKSHAVIAKKIRPNTITGAQIRESALSAVPNASRASTADRLQGLQPSDFTRSQQVVFGRGSASSVPAETILTVARLGVTVTTDGDSDSTAEIVVNLPSLGSGANNWGLVSDNVTTLTSGGAKTLTPASGASDITVQIWRLDTDDAMYLHCGVGATSLSGNSMGCVAYTT